jgi:hypothetical protein
MKRVESILSLVSDPRLGIMSSTTDGVVPRRLVRRHSEVVAAVLPRTGSRGIRANSPVYSGQWESVKPRVKRVLSR